MVCFRLGGTAGAVLTCPLEVVKTRLQSSVAKFDNPTSKTFVTTVGYRPQQPIASASFTTSCGTSSTQTSPATSTSSNLRPRQNTSLVRCIRCVEICQLSYKLTLSSLNLPLSSSPTTSCELLSQFSTCSWWRWFEVDGKINKNTMYQFNGNFCSKTLAWRKIKYVFRDVKWCFIASRVLEGLTKLRLFYKEYHALLKSTLLVFWVKNFLGYHASPPFIYHSSNTTNISVVSW